MGYLDPNIFGLLSQAGLAIFLVVVSVFAFFFNPIKRAFAKLIKKKNENQPPTPSDNNTPLQ